MASLQNWRSNAYVVEFVVPRTKIVEVIEKYPRSRGQGASLQEIKY